MHWKSKSELPEFAANGQLQSGFVVPVFRRTPLHDCRNSFWAAGNRNGAL